MYKAQSVKLSENPVVTQHSSTVELEETKKSYKATSFNLTYS